MIRRIGARDCTPAGRRLSFAHYRWNGTSVSPMSRSTKALLVLAVLAAAAAIGRPAHAQGIYAALAISSSTGVYGYGFNYDTQRGADDRAMQECRQRTQATDCRVYARFQRACIALAQATNNAFGWAIGYAADERSERALNECAFRNGGDCKVAAQFCSGTTGR